MILFDLCQHDFFHYNPDDWTRICDGCGGVSEDGYRFIPFETWTSILKKRKMIIEKILITVSQMKG